MPVARLKRIAADTVKLDAKFAPPLLEFAANEFIVSIARRLVEILSAKSGILAGMRRQKNQSLAEFTTADITAAISCPAGGAACPEVSVQADVTEHLKGNEIEAISAKKKPKPKTKRVVIGTATTILAAGATKTITIELNSTGLALLKRFGKLHTAVTVRSGETTIDTVNVTVQKAAKPKKRKAARAAADYPRIP